MWSRFVSGWSSMSARPSSIQIKWSDFIILGHSKKWWKCLCSESRPFPLHSMWVTQADFIRNVHQYYFCIVKYSKFWIYVHTRQPFTFDFMKSEILVWNTVYNVTSSNESYKYVTYLNVTLIAHFYSSSSEYTSFSVQCFFTEITLLFSSELWVLILAIMTLIVKIAKFSMHN